MHDIVVLVRQAAQPPAHPGALALTMTWLDDADAISSSLSLVGHAIPAHRLMQRLNNGLRLVRFEVDKLPVATTWVVGQPGRYIDEVNWLFPISTGELWLRDVHVEVSWRGRGLFDQIVRMLSEADSEGPRRLWSDVDRSNVISLRAHAASGFSHFARVRSIDIGGRFRLRGQLPAWPHTVEEIDPGTPWVCLRGERLARHRQLIA